MQYDEQTYNIPVSLRRGILPYCRRLACADVGRRQCLPAQGRQPAQHRRLCRHRAYAQFLQRQRVPLLQSVAAQGRPGARTLRHSPRRNLS